MNKHLNADFAELRSWIGRTETRTEKMTSASVAAMAATLDLPNLNSATGAELRLLWHWLFFTPLTLHRDIGPDGHAKRGGFLPPVPLPRRMWAGGRLEFHLPISIGDTLTRTSRIQDVNVKEGRSGTLVFVTVKHELQNTHGVALSEEHDIVYRDVPQPGASTIAPQSARRDHDFEREIVPDPVFLFRYSALTFNAHRIHYDRPYVTEVEGYPGLIVHGPLIATLLMDLVHRNLSQARVKRFQFRAVRPLFDTRPFNVCGKRESPEELQLWARDHDGYLAMEASAEIA